jgi:hypothetical protein
MRNEGSYLSAPLQCFRFENFIYNSMKFLLGTYNKSCKKFYLYQWTVNTEIEIYRSSVIARRAEKQYVKNSS